MRNARLLTAYSFARGALFCIPVITIFWSVHIGMSQTDIMILQAIFSVVMATMEFPTGYIADRIGHRKALVVSAFICIAGWVVYCLGRSFGEIVVAEALLGIGIAFHSGADSALLHASLGAEGKADSFLKWEGRLRASTQIGEAAASSIGGWLYALAPRLPLWLQIPGAVLALLAAVAMRNVSGDAPRPRSHLRHMAAIVKTSLWTHRELAAAMWLGVILSLATFFLVWLIQPYMKLTGVAIEWFGPIWAAANLWVAIASLSASFVARRFGANGALFLCVLLIAAGYGLLALTGSWWSFSFYFLIVSLRGINIPIVTAEVLRHTPEPDRAAVLSLKSMIFRFLFVASGPGVGLVADRIGLHFAIGISGLVMTLVALAAWSDFRRSRRPTSLPT